MVQVDKGNLENTTKFDALVTVQRSVPVKCLLNVFFGKASARPNNKGSRPPNDNDEII